MGNLSNDMRRLRREVDALRSDRGALMQSLASGAKNLTSTVSAMQAGFASAHRAMAKKTGEDRGAFVAGVISDVNCLLGDFSRDRVNMARKGKHDRGAFLSEMRRQVTGMCKDTADDLMGARIAWCGKSSGKSMSVKLKKEPVFAAPEFKAEKPPVTFWKPLKEILNKTTATHKAPAIDPPKAKTPPPVFAAPQAQKQKARASHDEKHAKAATKKKFDKK